MHSRYRLSGKTKKVYFSFSEKDTTVIPTWWTEGNRHDETGSRHNDVVLASDCQSTPTFRLINKSNTTGDVKACPRSVRPRVTTLRQGANIRRRHRRNRSLTVSTNARRTYMYRTIDMFRHIGCQIKLCFCWEKPVYF